MHGTTGEFTTTGRAGGDPAEVARLVGTVNAAPFLGHDAGTVLLTGVEWRGGRGGEEDRFHFSAEAGGWNAWPHREWGWVCRLDRDGRPTYPPADFSALPTRRHGRDA